MFRCSRQEYSEVLEDLCRHLSLNGRVESTQISYSRAVRDLMEDVGKVPLACSEQEVIRHLASCRDSHNLSSSALNSRISGIKYLYREVYRRLDIIVDLPNPRRARLQGDILTVEEVKRLFDGTRSIKHLAVLGGDAEPGIDPGVGAERLNHRQHLDCFRPGPEDNQNLLRHCARAPGRTTVDGSRPAQG